MGNQEEKIEKENIFTFCNKKYEKNTRTCGSRVVNEKKCIYNNFKNHNLYYEYQCYNCKKKEFKKRKKYLKNINYFNSDELNIVFNKIEIDDIKRLIKLNDSNYSYENFFNLFNNNKEKFLKIINTKFDEFGLKYFDHNSIDIKDVGYNFYNIYDYQGCEYNQKLIYKKIWKKNYQERKYYYIGNVPWTMLNLSIFFENYEIINFLLENGARIDIKDGFGYDSLQIAKMINNNKIINLLNEYVPIINFIKFNLFFNINIKYNK
jgi:hypothetical protein